MVVAGGLVFLISEALEGRDHFIVVEHFFSPLRHISADSLPQKEAKNIGR